LICEQENNLFLFLITESESENETDNTVPENVSFDEESDDAIEAENVENNKNVTVLSEASDSTENSESDTDEVIPDDQVNAIITQLHVIFGSWVQCHRKKRMGYHAIAEQQNWTKKKSKKECRP